MQDLQYPYMPNIWEDSVVFYGRWCHLILCGYYTQLESLML